MLRIVFLFLFSQIALWKISAQEFLYDHIPDYSDSTVSQMMNEIDSELPIILNERVKSFIDYFTIRDREYTREILSRASYYFELYEPLLRKYNLPDDIKYLSIVESGLRPQAVSRASAAGLWQFMESTGKIYGLKSDWYLDDRFDPIKATDAACRHLSDLYKMFGDWELAMAAYNCGPGNVNKAIKRSGYKRDFWEIFPYLPRETRSYVPQMYAVMYTLKNAEAYNLYPKYIYSQAKTDTIWISHYSHVPTLAEHIDVCEEDILALNPSILRGVVPEHARNYPVHIPIDKVEIFQKNRTEIIGATREVGKKELEYLARNTPGSTYGRTKTIYKVRSGDVLGKIAQRHNVTVADIKKWNNLTSSTIRIGQNLAIWVLPVYSTSTKDKYVTATEAPTRNRVSQNAKTYKVQAGDTLWSISQSTNVSIETLKKINSLISNNIQPGQTLKLSQ